VHFGVYTGGVSVSQIKVGSNFWFMVLDKLVCGVDKANRAEPSYTHDRSARTSAVEKSAPAKGGGQGKKLVVWRTQGCIWTTGTDSAGQTWTPGIFKDSASLYIVSEIVTLPTARFANFTRAARFWSPEPLDSWERRWWKKLSGPALRSRTFIALCDPNMERTLLRDSKSSLKIR